MRTRLYELIGKSSIPEPNTGCHFWLGATNPDGYGVISFMRNGRMTSTSAQRIAWEMVNGDIPKGLQIDHLCRVRCCVNPAHLEAVSARENVRRGTSVVAENMDRQSCWKGHLLTKENVRLRDGRRRECMECSRKCDRERKQRRRDKAKQCAQ